MTIPVQPLAGSPDFDGVVVPAVGVCRPGQTAVFQMLACGLQELAEQQVLRLVGVGLGVVDVQFL